MRVLKKDPSIMHVARYFYQSDLYKMAVDEEIGVSIDALEDELGSLRFAEGFIDIVTELIDGSYYQQCYPEWNKLFCYLKDKYAIPPNTTVLVYIGA